MSYDRAAHIRQLVAAYHAGGIQHPPVHPALGSHYRVFEEAYPLGRISEELTRPLLRQLFPSPPHVLIAHCDTDVETRRIGKSVEIGGIRYALPDYEVRWQSTQGPRGLYIDVKSKEYHSLRRQTGHLEQFIDQDALEKYLFLARMMGYACWILFHLWPLELMHSFGKASAARYTAGTGYVIPAAQLDQYVQRFPVDDVYYQISAQALHAKGTLRMMKHDEGRTHCGYFIEVQHMQQRSGKDESAWRRPSPEEMRRDP